MDRANETSTPPARAAGAKARGARSAESPAKRPPPAFTAWNLMLAAMAALAFVARRRRLD
jgi:hypothetical protein